MGALLLKVWAGIKSLVGLLVPLAGGVRQVKGWSATVRWTVRILLILLIFIGLRFLSEYLQPDIAGVVEGGEFIHHWYLPILFLIFLGLVWLGVYLWYLLTEEDVSDYPDIDAAWKEAMTALVEAGIDLKRVSVFLILGQTAGGEDYLFEAAVPSTARPLRVRGAPRRLAPLHVYATEDAVYVTCARCSVLGRHAMRLLRGESSVLPAPEPSASSAVLGRSMRQTIFETMQPGGHMAEVPKLLARAAREKRELTPEEKDELNRLLVGDAKEALAPQRRGPRAFIRDEAETEEFAARLEHLCRLIARWRQPELPVRGVLVLVPWSGTESEEAANATSDACRRDLAAVRAALQVFCPQIALVCDLEMAPGFHEFLAQFDEKLRRTGRVGRSFPLAVDPRALSKVIDGGMERFCSGEFSTWVYEFFRLEEAEADNRAAITAANIHLYQLLVQLLERRQRLSRILSRGMVVEASEPPMLAGCYLAGTGADAGERAFVAAVFHRLLKERENVSWTPDALAADASHRRWGAYGLVGLGGFVALVVGATYVLSR
jgi:hypothetical protein